METEGQTPVATAEGQTPATEQTAQPTNPEPKTYDEAYVKTLRSENASYRTKLRDYEKAEDDRKAASLSELEKAQKAATDADARATASEQRLAKRDALDALRTANVIDADLAFMAIRDGIQMKDGEPVNIAELVADFVKARPAMVKTVAPKTESTNPAPPSKAVTPARYVGRL